MATRKEVAEKAGVSQAVVSYVVNNSNYVHSKTRERVEKVIEEMGYRPNLIARSLRMERSHHLAFICNDFNNITFSQIAANVTRIAFDNGYLLSINDVGYDDARIELLLQYKVDGMFICSDLFSSEQINRFVEQGTAVVLLANRDYPGLNPSVGLIKIDIYHGMATLMEHLVSKGHHRFAFIWSSQFGPNKAPSVKVESYRYLAYQNTLKKYGYTGRDFKIGSVFDHDGITAAIDQIMQDGKITVIGAGNDSIACMVISQLKQKGIRVPEDIAVTGYDGVWIAENFSPTLTTVDLGIQKLGTKSIDLLLKIIRKQPYGNVTLECNLLKRESG